MRKSIYFVVSFALPVLIALAGLGLVVVLRVVTYEQVFNWLIHFSVSGKLASFTPEKFLSIRGKATGVGIGLIGLGVALFVFRARVWESLRWLVGAGADWGRAVRRAYQAFRRDETPAHQAIVATIIAAGTLIRLAHLAGPMRSDESYTFMHYVSAPLLIGLSNYSEPNNHLFHTLLAHISTSLFGNNPVALRLPALLFGLVLLPLIYVVGRAVATRTAATIATALVAVSYQFISYAINARGYAIAQAFFLLTVLCLWRLRQGPSRAATAALVLIGMLGLWTIPAFMFAFGGALAWHGLWLLTATRGPARWQGLLRLAGIGALAGAGAALCYMPAVLVMGDRMSHNPYFNHQEIPQLIASLPYRVGLVYRYFFDDELVVIPLAIAVGVVATVVGGRRRYADLLLLLSSCLVVTAVLILVSHIYPPERVQLPLLLVLFLCTGAGAEVLLDWLGAATAQRLRPAVQAAGAAAVVLITALWLVFYTADRFMMPLELRDSRAVATYLRTTVTPADLVVAGVCSGGCSTLEYIYRNDLHASPPQLIGYDFGPASVRGVQRFFLLRLDAEPPVDERMRKLGTLTSAFTAPHLLQRFRGAQLYCVDRKAVVSRN